MRDRFFRWLGRVTYRKYWAVIAIGFLVTVILGGLASRIKIEATWISMMPAGSRSVQAFQTVVDEFGAATNIVVALEGPGKESIIRAADDIAPDLEKITIEYNDENGHPVRTKAFKRVEHKYDVDFFRKHGLMLEKAKNLEKNKILFTDYNLLPFLTHVNDVYEEQWISDSDNLTKQEKDAEKGMDGMFQLFHTMSDFAIGKISDSVAVQKGVDALTVGDGYILSGDKRMLLILITPTMSIDDIDPSVIAADSLDSKLRVYAEKYPDIRFGATGMHMLMRDEMHAGMTDTIRNLLFAGILILAIFILSFRMWTGPLLAMLVLLTGITWDVGIAQIVFGRLNIVTAMCSVILLGLGIDYAIHIISSYSELRHKGESIENAIAMTYRKIGSGLLTGALTTAIAFFAITIVGSAAFREFGFVVGAGIICCLASSVFLLPAVIVAKDRIWHRLSKREQPKRVDMEFRFLGRTAGLSSRIPWVTVIIALLITVFLGFMIPRGRMNRNYMDLEPEGLESVRLQREIAKRFHMSPDNMMAIYDNINDVDRVQDLLYSKPSVGMVESIASALPPDNKQQKRRPYVEEVHNAQKNIPPETRIDAGALIEQLRRFSDNIVELSSMSYVSGLDKAFDKANEFIGLDEEGDQVGINYAEQLADYIESRPGAVARLENYQRYFRTIMKERMTEMSDPGQITLDMLPASYRERYVSEDGSHYLVAFYSKKDIWDGLFTSPFLKTIIRNVPDATGSPVFMVELIEVSKREGIFSFAVALLAILILLFLDFRSIKTTLIAMIPLLMSVTWLFGLMGLFDIKYSIVNVIGFPLLLGIGIDDGVHVIHRYRVEGKGRLVYSMSSIGKAIMLTSVTTMLGFGSLMSSDYRGYIGLGLVVMLGIGLCFVTSVIILPAVMKLAWGGKKTDLRFFTGSGA